MLTTIEEAREVLAVEEQGLSSVRQKIGDEFDHAIRVLLNCQGRIVITGIGKSGIIGQKITATMNSTGSPSCFLHPVEALHGDLGMLSDQDVVLAISYSGETKELNSLLAIIKKRGNKIIAMTSRNTSSLGSLADVVLSIKVPREACPLGLAPTASTTATLALGDALSVVLLNQKNFKATDFRENHPGGSLGERLKVKVEEVMITGHNVPFVVESNTVQVALAKINEKNLGAVVIVDSEEKVKGILTDGDVRRMLVEGQSFQGKSIESIMTRDPITIGSEVLAVDALSIMQQHEVTILPIVSNRQKLLGILHLHNLLGKGEFRFLL